jgi:hypothetical protein
VFQLHEVLSDKVNYSNTYLIQLLCLFSNCETMSATLSLICNLLDPFMVPYQVWSASRFAFSDTD